MALFAAGLALSFAIGLLGYWRSSLTAGGVAGAVLTGSIVFGLGGLTPGLALVAFFASSSLLSHFRLATKEQLEDKFQKTGRRDLGQALANGGLATVLVLIALRFPSPAIFAGIIGSLAAVTADTWATELGVLSGRDPRLITTGRPVAAGTSGGISALGTLASLGGALCIGLVAAAGLAFTSIIPWRWLEPLRWPTGPADWAALAAIAGVAGLSGSLFDSLLGATVQGIYHCDTCDIETEKRVHRCGRSTRRIRGLAILDNDLINFAASVFGSALAVVLWLALPV